MIRFYNNSNVVKRSLKQQYSCLSLTHCLLYFAWSFCPVVTYLITVSGTSMPASWQPSTYILKLFSIFLSNCSNDSNFDTDIATLPRLELNKLAKTNPQQRHFVDQAKFKRNIIFTNCILSRQRKFPFSHWVFQSK